MRGLLRFWWRSSRTNIGPNIGLKPYKAQGGCRLRGSGVLCAARRSVRDVKGHGCVVNGITLFRLHAATFRFCGCDEQTLEMHTCEPSSVFQAIHALAVTSPTDFRRMAKCSQDDKLSAMAQLDGLKRCDFEGSTPEVSVEAMLIGRDAVMQSA